MKNLITFIVLIILIQVQSQTCQKIHRKDIVVDTHNYILMKAADIRIKQNKIAAYFINTNKT
jgi:hypothetical protein